MRVIETKKELPDCHDIYVRVLQDDQVYVRHGQDYIAKQYFTAPELQKILGLTRHRLHRLCRRHGLIPVQNNYKRIRLTLEQLRVLL